MKRILLTIIMLVSLVFASRAEKVTVTISVLVPGTLNEVLGDRALDMDSLIVSGNLNTADFEALASYGSYERMYGLNIYECNVEDNTLPKNALSFSWITSVTLPEKLTKIDDCAMSATHVNTNVVIPASVEELGIGCFNTSQFITSVEFDDNSKVKVIPDFCFEECNNLKHIKLPNGVTRLGKACLCHTHLEEINLPESVEYIDGGAFALINGLKTIKCYGTLPPETNGNIFDFEKTYGYIELYVPIGCKAAYMDHPEWGKFNNIIESADVTSIESIKSSKPTSTIFTRNNIIYILSDTQDVDYQIYDANGNLIYSSEKVQGSAQTDYLPGGLYIVKCGNISTKIII